MTAVDNHREVGPNPGAMPNFALARVARSEPGYPARLERLSKPPAQLWVDGEVPGPVPGAVAIVGARSASRAGRDFAHGLATALARAGIAVVSGGAYGIDAAAHEGALAAGGRTYAVFGCGVDVIYPDRHASLFARIATQGGLLSEYDRGTQPRPGQFPARNRIIAALSDLVVVVEAAHRSGALSTAAEARRVGVKVAARPGSGGTDRLIGKRALEVSSPEDVFAVLAGHTPKPPVPPAWTVAGEDPAMHRFARLFQVMGDISWGADQLALQLRCPVSEVLGMVGQAEIEGWIRRVPGGAYEVTRGH